MNFAESLTLILFLFREDLSITFQTFSCFPEERTTFFQINYTSGN